MTAAEQHQRHGQNAHRHRRGEWQLGRRTLADRYRDRAGHRVGGRRDSRLGLGRSLFGGLGDIRQGSDGSGGRLDWRRGRARPPSWPGPSSPGAFLAALAGPSSLRPSWPEPSSRVPSWPAEGQVWGPGGGGRGGGWGGRVGGAGRAEQDPCRPLTHRPQPTRPRFRLLGGLILLLLPSGCSFAVSGVPRWAGPASVSHHARRRGESNP